MINSSGASFGIRLHRGPHVLTSGEHRNRINCALGRRQHCSETRQLAFTVRPKANLTPGLSLTLLSALYCASPCWNADRIGSGGGNRTRDLQVMSLTSCRCSTPHDQSLPQVVVEKWGKQARSERTGNQRFAARILRCFRPQDIVFEHVSRWKYVKVFIMRVIECRKRTSPARPPLAYSERKNRIVSYQPATIPITITDQKKSMCLFLCLRDVGGIHRVSLESTESLPSTDRLQEAA
jgi:hypothetical protein